MLRSLIALLAILGSTPALTASGPTGPAQEPLVSERQATTVAVNRLTPTPAGWRLDHPSYSVRFDERGLELDPRSGPRWGFRLTEVSVGGQTLARVEATPPRSRERFAVAYVREGIVEEYVVRAADLEQRFLVDPFEGRHGTLVIAGRIHSKGAFSSSGDGWSWSDGAGAVRLGDVTVFDADGREVESAMAVTAESATITVAEEAWSEAVFPLLVDPTIGPILRISEQGPVGDTAYAAFDPDVAFNPDLHQYLVVWSGDANSLFFGGQVDNEFEIFVQRVDAATGDLLGGRRRISDMGGLSDTDYTARRPAVAYDTHLGQYLVVWEGTDNTPISPFLSLVPNEFEIFGQLLSSTADEIGANDFRISDMGGTGNTNYPAHDPDVAFNFRADEYLVVWSGEDTVPPLVDGEAEIFAQRLDATGAAVGANDFRISDMGPDGDPLYDAFEPAVAYDYRADQYLVVWEGDDNSGGTFKLVDGEFEIFGQLLGANGAEINSDFRISAMGPTGNAAYDAQSADVAYNLREREYLVVWSGDDDQNGLVEGEFEIFGRIVDADFGVLQGFQFRISEMGGTGNAAYDASHPAVTHDWTANEYLVVWHGDQLAIAAVNDALTVYGRRVDGVTHALAGGAFRLGFPATSPLSDSQRPAVAGMDGFSNRQTSLTVWYGFSTLEGDPIDQETYGRLYRLPTIFRDGFETGSTSSWWDVFP